ncbi:MAG: FecR domain-containing protein [Haliscomenobacter sp.]|nr:FecR domain-containing protein [Haliscomenobacter sp.]
MIDLSTIWKNLQNQASEEERRKLDLWLEEDPKHHQYYSQLRASQKEKKPAGYFKQGEDQAWERFQRNAIQKKQPKYLFPALAVAAAVILAFFTFNRAFFRVSGPPEGTSIAETSAAIPPGSAKAILTLHQGRNIFLSGPSSFSFQEPGARVRVEGGKIVYSGQNKAAAPNGKAASNLLKAPRGGEFFVELSDGTRVWLNAETELNYPVRFTGGERRVQLTGEAYFEVAKKEGQVFTVLAGGQRIEALGTAFNVSAYGSESASAVTLVEGAVKVSLTKDPEAFRILAPGEQSLLEKGSGSLIFRKADPAMSSSWKNGLFSFKDATLEHMLNVFSRWYDVDFKLEDHRVGALKFSGDLDRKAPLRNVLHLIEETNEIQFEFVGNQTVLVK